MSAKIPAANATGFEKAFFITGSRGQGNHGRTPHKMWDLQLADRVKGFGFTKNAEMDALEMGATASLRSGHFTSAFKSIGELTDHINSLTAPARAKAEKQGAQSSETSSNPMTSKYIPEEMDDRWSTLVHTAALEMKARKKLLPAIQCVDPEDGEEHAKNILNFRALRYSMTLPPNMTGPDMEVLKGTTLSGWHTMGLEGKLFTAEEKREEEAELQAKIDTIRANAEDPKSAAAAANNGRRKSNGEETTIEFEGKSYTFKEPEDEDSEVTYPMTPENPLGVSPKEQAALMKEAATSANAAFEGTGDPQKKCGSAIMWCRLMGYTCDSVRMTLLRADFLVAAARFTSAEVLLRELLARDGTAGPAAGIDLDYDPEAEEEVMSPKDEKKNKKKGGKEKEEVTEEGEEGEEGEEEEDTKAPGRPRLTAAQLLQVRKRIVAVQMSVNCRAGGAIPAIIKFCADFPGDTEAHSLLGAAHLQNGEWLSAAHAYEHALVCDPTNAATHCVLADIRYSIGSTEVATGSPVFPEDKDVETFLASTVEGQVDPESYARANLLAARRHYAMALQVRPQYPRALWGMALVTRILSDEILELQSASGAEEMKETEVIGKETEKTKELLSKKEPKKEPKTDLKEQYPAALDAISPALNSKMHNAAAKGLERMRSELGMNPQLKRLHDSVLEVVCL